MTGLTSGQAAFGGVALAPGQSPPDLITAQDRAKELIDRTYGTVLNRNPTQAGYNFYLPKILSGELNANNIIPTLIGGATSGPDKEVAADLKKPPIRLLRTLVDPYNRFCACC
jgi:hypothetical protein